MLGLARKFKDERPSGNRGPFSFKSSGSPLYGGFANGIQNVVASRKWL